MSGSVSSDQAEPNLTPILDMVFQLITFFMLVANFKANALDKAVKLPVVGTALPVETQAGDEDLLVVNVDEAGRIKAYNTVIEDIYSYMRRASAAVRLKEGIEEHGELKSKIVIRADKDVRFEKMYAVIDACQKSGYRRFALVAKDPKTAAAEAKAEADKKK